MPYTPILSPADLSTHIYAEVLNEITRDDGGTLPTQALSMAFQEAKAYLGRYDTLALFGDATLGVSATVADDFLNNLLKDLAVWFLVKLGSPSINYEHARWCYEDATERLKSLQTGTLVPQEWPLANTSLLAPTPGDAVASYSNCKQATHF
jgi:hypothetical protein